MAKRLAHIAKISFGLYRKSGETGDIPYLLASQFDKHGYLSEGFQTFLLGNSQIQKHLLKKGDIILAAKGFRHFAWEYQEVYGPMIPSSMFFVIRPDTRIVNPSFLAVFLNLPGIQDHFKALSAGSNIPSLRKGELGELKIALPDLNVQKSIADLRRIHETELALSEKIIKMKKRLFHGTVQHLITT